MFSSAAASDRGGHNVLEPAAHGVPVVTGAHTHNFHAIVELLNEANALVQLAPVEGAEAVAELTEVVQRLLAEPEWRRELATRAKRIIDDNQGAAERTMKLIAPLFSAPQSAGSTSDSLLPANAHGS